MNNIEVHYYVEQKPGLLYQESYIRCLCTECKTKLFPDKKMMCYDGAFGNFDINCYACEKLLYESNKG